MRTLALLIGVFFISLLAMNMAINRVTPFWTVEVRKEIAKRSVELFWEKGVRLIWEGGYEENITSYNLSLRIGIPVPGEPEMIYVEIYGGNN